MKKNKIYNVQCSYCGTHRVSSGLSTVHCTQYVLHIVHCTVSVEVISMSSEHCSLCTSPSGCSLQCTLYKLYMHCTKCVLHILLTAQAYPGAVHCNVHCAQCVLHNIVKCEHCTVSVEAYPGAFHCNVHFTQCVLHNIVKCEHWTAVHCLS
jgi:hypothetical protein